MDTMKDKAAEAAIKRYDRIASIYDFMEGFAERWRFGRWRRMLWDNVEGGNILEVGVGTGKNFPYYPATAELTAIDFSDKMLARARYKAHKQGIKVRLLRMDAQNLEFADNTFDMAVGTFVFCSVPDPILGLREVERVVKPGGKVLLLEHVLAANRILASLMNLVNPVVVRAMGANINRQTVENVARTGLTVEHVTDLGAGIFKLIQARKS